jgi:CrcB protein
MNTKRIRSLAACSCAVFFGGSIGAFCRISLSSLQPTRGFPLITFLINISGTLMLGFLLELLARTGEDSGKRKLFRLAVGTGILGGYTTYSTFIIEVDTRLLQGAIVAGLSYACISIFLGLIAAAGGAKLGSVVFTKWAISRQEGDPE